MTEATMSEKPQPGTEVRRVGMVNRSQDDSPERWALDPNGQMVIMTREHYFKLRGRTFSQWLHETDRWPWARRRFRRQWTWLLAKIPVRYRD